MIGIAVALLVESMDWADRAAIVDPLVAKLYPVTVRRFNRQRNYFLKHGLTPLSEYFIEAAKLKRKPPQSAVNNTVDTLDNFTFALFNRTFEDAVKAAAVGGGKLADADGLQVSFTLKSKPVLDYIREHSAAKLGRDVDATTKDLLRKMITTAYDEQWTRAALVKKIKGLYSGFTARAPQKHIANRAELIAVTELGNAMSYGTLEGAKSLQSRGLTMEKSWGLAVNPCPLCQDNANQGWIPVGETFSSGHEHPTAHPACRCSLMTRAAEQRAVA